MRRCGSSALLALVVLAWPAAAAAQNPRAEDLVARATEYMAEFVAKFSGVVAEEDYQQRHLRERTSRHLRSDFLIVQIPGGMDWLSFRDVVEVDGKPVGDRDQRLVRLFLEPPSDSLVRRAQEIDRAGARYNLHGDLLNNPLTAIALVQDVYRARLRWSLVRNDREMGPQVWSVRFEERQRPTILRGNGNRDLPMNGLMWIESPTGRVLKTELRLDMGGRGVGAGLVIRNQSEIVTTFRFDERFGIAVPAEMRESHVFGSSEVDTVATYGRFRRFGVTTEENVNPR
ncbi:MAG: hypothetical protein FJW14_19485 [Acidimicrobiia bacterium]|nr:hypothetical protein [Acidimicrobiia bacterium]